MLPFLPRGEQGLDRLVFSVRHSSARSVRSLVDLRHLVEEETVLSMEELMREDTSERVLEAVEEMLPRGPDTEVLLCLEDVRDVREHCGENGT